ncbi:MAG: tetraacyldisaccharide 4'-kinase [Abyssibacter sp.]|uniref:tetraacyldisaccharide 4'-kinase n=1 Tax=Abyssibacter sp. TaxID=2320200 RepID=UPI00321B708C
MSLIERAWQSRGHPLAWLLLPLAGLFSVVVQLRRMAYRYGLLTVQTPAVPVIVVGNLTVGGVGKTPLVLWLAQHLQTRGLRVGVVSRGYGRQTRGLVLSDAASVASAAALGDEPALLADAGIPVAVAERRSQAVAALAPHCDVLLADDGLQHYAMGRAAELLVVDGQRQFGNRWLLPAGPLREPVRRGLRCDLVLVRGGGLPALEAARRCLPTASAMSFDVLAGRVTALDAGSSTPISQWAGREVHAVAGIGVPDRFFDALRQAGLQVQAHAFPDHHAFCAEDLAFGDGRPVLMTSKDAVKCRAFADSRMYEVIATVVPDPALPAAVDALVAALRGPA